MERKKKKASIMKNKKKLSLLNSKNKNSINIKINLSEPKRKRRTYKRRVQKKEEEKEVTKPQPLSLLPSRSYTSGGLVIREPEKKVIDKTKETEKKDVGLTQGTQPTATKTIPKRVKNKIESIKLEDIPKKDGIKLAIYADDKDMKGVQVLYIVKNKVFETEDEAQSYADRKQYEKPIKRVIVPNNERNTQSSQDDDEGSSIPTPNTQEYNSPNLQPEEKYSQPFSEVKKEEVQPEEEEVVEPEEKVDLEQLQKESDDVLEKSPLSQMETPKPKTKEFLVEKISVKDILKNEPIKNRLIQYFQMMEETDEKDVFFISDDLFLTLNEKEMQDYMRARDENKYYYFTSKSLINRLRKIDEEKRRKEEPVLQPQETLTSPNLQPQETLSSPFNTKKDAETEPDPITLKGFTPVPDDTPFFTVSLKDSNGIEERYQVPSIIKNYPVEYYQLQKKKNSLKILYLSKGNYKEGFVSLKDVDKPANEIPIYDSPMLLASSFKKK